MCVALNDEISDYHLIKVEWYLTWDVLACQDSLVKILQCLEWGCRSAWVRDLRIGLSPKLRARIDILCSYWTWLHVIWGRKRHICLVEISPRQINVHNFIYVWPSNVQTPGSILVRYNTWDKPKICTHSYLETHKFCVSHILAQRKICPLLIHVLL